MSIIPQGKVASRVESHNGKLKKLEVTVPVGSTATVFLPAEASQVKESGRSLKKGKGITAIVEDNGTTKVEIGQGKYFFAIE